VSGFVKTGIYLLNPDVSSEEDLISGEVSSAVTVTTKVDGAGPGRGGIDPSDGKDGADPSKVAKSSGRCFSITDISPLPSTSGLQITIISRSKRHSEILTLTPRKDLLEEGEVRKIKSKMFEVKGKNENEKRKGN
jgi:hypothetical protein